MSKSLAAARLPRLSDKILGTPKATTKVEKVVKSIKSIIKPKK